MTSPPYWALRDYGEEGQLGLEDTPEQYVENLIEVFNELKRVLKPTGTFFLNIDDTYSRGSRPKDASEDSLRKDNGSEAGEPDEKIKYDLPDKSMSMIPERVMMAMVDNGWILRNKIIWRKKGGGMPESVKDRFSTTWEYVYMFSLNQDYYFDLDAVREPHKKNSLERDKRGVNKNKWTDGADGQSQHSMQKPTDEQNALNPKGKNPGDMWTISTASMSEAHFAVYPDELCEKPVKAGCPKKVCVECGKPYERNVQREKVGETKARNNLETGCKNGLKWDGPADAEIKGWNKQCSCETDNTKKGTILDPFSGAGTTCLAARQHNRNYIGIELNKEYAEMARKRIKEKIGGIALDNFVK